MSTLPNCPKCNSEYTIWKIPGYRQESCRSLRFTPNDLKGADVFLGHRTLKRPTVSKLTQ
jgi:hypothetical protein